MTNAIINFFIVSPEILPQEVFTAVYLSLDRYGGDSKLSTWIYSIALNKSNPVVSEIVTTNPIRYNIIATIPAEPVEIKYMWSFDKREHRYYPDFYMKTRGLEGEEEFLVEIKPEAQITKPKPPTKNSQKALKSYKFLAF